MFSQFFVLSLRGDTILHKDCKYLIRLAPPSDTSGKTAKIMATESETDKSLPLQRLLFDKNLTDTGYHHLFADAEVVSRKNTPYKHAGVLTDKVTKIDGISF